MKRSDRLQQLRTVAARMQPDAAGRASEFAQVRDHAERFLEQLTERNVVGAHTDRAQALAAMALSAQPSNIADALTIIERFVDNSGYHLGSSRFFGYIPSGGLYESALGDYLADVSNRYAGVGLAAPGAARMEQTLLRWLADVVGYPKTAEGDLTSGGSMATLSALVTAREASKLDTRRIPQSVVYVTAQTHHTLHKALQIAGLAECVVRILEVDERQRLEPQSLAKMIDRDKAQGLKPWLVVATAGTTDVGAVDPLDAIADIAQEQGLWLHVDAAYGGAFVLCNEGKKRLKGINRADSLILDPHKGFFLPCGTGVVLVRDGRRLFEAYRARGVYMQDVAHDDERSACDYSPELTRPFRAMRFWLPLKVHGTEPFAAALEEKLLLAQYFYEQIGSIASLRVGPTPDLSIVNFRFTPTGIDADVAGQALIEAITADGRVFISSTRVNGQFVIRFAILNFMSHLEEVDLALTVLREQVETVSAELRASSAKD
ncbi:MAG: pyridoxal phosphate-dependent decarboxylase family protein [Pseudomonadales bacterium]